MGFLYILSAGFLAIDRVLLILTSEQMFGVGGRKEAEAGLTGRVSDGAIFIGVLVVGLL